MSEPDFRSYYGRPVLKEPVWRWQVPCYLFLGGLAGASAVLAAVARARGLERLAARAQLVNIVAIAVSPALLIADLGRPERFYRMLRVFKVTSPMSIGTWVLMASGAASATAAAAGALGRRRVQAAGEWTAAALGPVLTTYTAVLVSDTAVPVWHEARRELPFVFAAGSAASAGAAAAMLSASEARPARRLALAGAAVELAAATLMEKRLGFLAEPYRQGAAGRYARAAKALTTAGAVVSAVVGRRRIGAIVGGTLVLGGSLAQRWSVFEAGFASARDPKYTVVPQRLRLDRPAT